MTVTVYRIGTDTQTYVASDLSGAGAKKTGGRWNSVGIAMVYASETRALACLETVVHLNAAGLPLNRYLVEITIPDPIWAGAQRHPAPSLPIGWDAEPAGLASLHFGNRWIASAGSPLLIVASVVVPEEINVLINPQHPESVQIRAAKVRKWLYDPRLTKLP